MYPIIYLGCKNVNDNYNLANLKVKKSRNYLVLYFLSDIEYFSNILLSLFCHYLFLLTLYIMIYIVKHYRWQEILYKKVKFLQYKISDDFIIYR